MLMKAYGLMCFYLGMFFLKRLFPCISMHNDPNDDNSNVEAVCFAINESILETISARKHWRDNRFKD